MIVLYRSVSFCVISPPEGDVRVTGVSVTVKQTGNTVLRLLVEYNVRRF